MCNLLLLSNSTMPGTAFFTWPKPFVSGFLSPRIQNLLFIPYAAVTFSFDEYEAKVKEVFSVMGFGVTSIHHVSDPVTAVAEANGILVGGGNSFALLSRIQEHKLIDPIRRKIFAGTPYIGWSAGANLACPTIMTTNDMPIVQPRSLEALGLVPFQINPHYHELRFENQGGETRKERIEEFLMMNRDKGVIGLPEGMLLQRNDDKLLLRGEGTAKFYHSNRQVEDLSPNQDLSRLLK